MSNEQIRSDILEIVTDTPNDQDALVSNLAIKHQVHEDVVLGEIQELLAEHELGYDSDFNLVRDERPTHPQKDKRNPTDEHVRNRLSQGSTENRAGNRR